MKCVICNKKIRENSDKWVRLTDFNRKEINGECYYHLKCWRDKFKIVQQRIHEETKRMFAPALGALGNVVRKIKDNQQNSGMVVEV